MTEQEKYYERMNRQSEENGRALNEFAMMALIVLCLFLLWTAWPFFLGLAVVSLIGYTIYTLITTIKEILDDIINYVKSTIVYKFFDKMFGYKLFNFNINFALVFDSLALIMLASFLISIIVVNVLRI